MVWFTLWTFPISNHYRKRSAVNIWWALQTPWNGSSKSDVFGPITFGMSSVRKSLTCFRGPKTQMHEETCAELQRTQPVSNFHGIEWAAMLEHHIQFVWLYRPAGFGQTFRALQYLVSLSSDFTWKVKGQSFIQLQNLQHWAHFMVSNECFMKNWNAKHTQSMDLTSMKVILLNCLQQVFLVLTFECLQDSPPVY